MESVGRDIGDTFPGIENTPGVCGDEPCIVRTRIPVWVLVRARQLGKNDADAVLLYAITDERALLTLNRKHFIQLHKEEPNHFGIILCSLDPEFIEQANRIHNAIQSEEPISGKLIRVNRLP